MLTNEEKRFVEQALKANAPQTFIAHHVWLCRELKLTPEMQKLEEVADECQAFVLGQWQRWEDE